jgi:uncharacterized protein (DUF1697 family)
MTDITILLLRGVNVGGANRLPMPEFRQFLTESGLAQVQTYIQSGNVVFHGDFAARAADIAAGMVTRFGFAPRMFSYALPDYQAILAANPFAAQGAQDGKAVHIFFLGTPMPAADAQTLAALASRDERLVFTPLAAYLYAPAGIGRSALAEKLGQTRAVELTARNYTSAIAIATLARSILT